MTESATATLTLPDRSEVDPRHAWDLSKLFTDESAWEAELATEQAALPALVAFQGRLGEGAAIVRSFLDLDVASRRRVERLFNYAGRRADEDLQNSHFMGLRERVMTLYNKKQEGVSFFNAELLGLSDETLDAYHASPELEPYTFLLEKLRRKKPHTLGEKEERILALAGEVTKAPYDIFGQLNNADLRFGTITDEDGREVEVTHGSYSSFLQKRDRTVRKAFFDKYYAAFDAHRHTLATSLGASVRRNAFYAKARGHESARAAALFANNIPESVYDNLIGAVHDNLDTLYRYYDLRKKVLKLDTVHMYDTMVPLVPKIEMHHTYDEASELILKALAPLGEEYTSVLGDGLLGGWVDRYENRGKRSGAYSSGCYDSDPYILMNFKDDNLNDVYTLAHEAGHSMHSWHSNRTQPPHYADYSIFVAEVASTFNEALLTRHLLETTEDPARRAFILNREIDAIRGTLFRQTMFAEFEHRLHKRYEDGKPLSLDDLKVLYHEMLERYFGPRFTLDPVLDLECFRIPHFYYNFYVFQYATGISAAYALARKVLAEGAPAIEAYKGFLSSGSSAYPIEVLKRAGVDMESPAPVEATLQHFAARVEELEGLIG